MSLTLVQLATAIEQGKTIELRYKGVWSGRDHIAEIFGYYRDFPEHVRIKPEPQDLWIVSKPHGLCESIRTYDVLTSEPEAIPKGSTIMHVKEVL